MSHPDQTVTLRDVNLELKHDPDQREFSAWHDDTRVSTAAYLDRGHERLFHHTATLPAWGGRGIAAVVVRYALDATVAEGKTIVPACSYVADYVREHDDWNDHLAQ